MDDQTNGTTAYDYTDAQRRLMQKQALAQALMGSQAPAPYEVVPGSTSKGSGGGWVVPNKWGAASSALQKALGGVMLASSNKDQQADTQNQRSALMSALQKIQSPVTQIQNVPSSTQPEEASSNDDDGTLSEVQPTAQKEQVVSRPQTQSEQMGGILDLMKSGPMGQAMAGQMLTPHQYDYIKDDNTGKITGVDKINPNNHVTVDAGTGGMNPKVAADAQTLIRNTDTSNADAVSATNAQLVRMGYTQQPLSAKQMSGMQSTTTERADVPLKAAQTTNTAANTNKTNFETSNVLPATVANTNANTTAANVKTGIDAVDQLSTAQQDVAAKSNDLDRTTRAMALASKVGGSKPAATLGDLENAVGSNPNFAEYKALLSIDGLSSIRSAMQSRMGQQEFNKLFPSQVSPSMPTSAVMQLLDLNRKLQQTDLGISKNKVMNLSQIGSQVGVTPGAGTAPQGNGFSLPPQ